jgi:hypothetical protein
MNIRPEGGALQPGFNFYPLSEYKTSIGFVYVDRNGKISVYRYAPHIHKLYLGT